MSVKSRTTNVEVTVISDIDDIGTMEFVAVTIVGPTPVQFRLRDPESVHPEMMATLPSFAEEALKHAMSAFDMALRNHMSSAGYAVVDHE